MGKYTKTRIRRKKTVKRSSRKSKQGGVRGPCVNTDLKIAEFKITNDNIAGFIYNVRRPADCVINAMQIIGMITPDVANIMRIERPEAQASGFTPTQIKAFFRSVYHREYQFDKSYGFDDFANRINNCLSTSHVSFCGWEDSNNMKHVFLIGRTEQDIFYFIDPQLGPNLLNLSENFDILKGKQNLFILETNYKPLTQSTMFNAGYVDASKAKPLPSSIFALPLPSKTFAVPLPSSTFAMPSVSASDLFGPVPGRSPAPARRMFGPQDMPSSSSSRLFAPKPSSMGQGSKMRWAGTPSERMDTSE